MKMSHVPRTVAALSMLAAFGSAPAFAVSVSYNLDQSNINAPPYLDGTNFLQATISDNANGNIDFLVQTLAALSSNAGTNYGIDSFGFNTNLSLTAANFIGLPAGWTVQSAMNQDGFGNFVAVVNGTGSFRVDPLSFSITGISGDAPIDYVKLSTGNAGEGNTFFAAHVAGFSTKVTSGFFAGSTEAGGPPASVPEAGVWGMMLAGLGLIGQCLRRRGGSAHLNAS